MTGCPAGGRQLTILDHYTQTLAYHRAFAHLYGDLLVEAIRVGSDDEIQHYVHKATYHAWCAIFAVES